MPPFHLPATDASRMVRTALGRCRFSTAGWAAALLLLAGCGDKKDPKAAGQGAEQVTESRTAEGLVAQSVDLNGDGEPDVFNFYQERGAQPRLLVRKEVDLNVDGVVDVVSFFDESGQLTREEMDGDFDGRFDWIDHYQGGNRVMSEVDTDYDGVPNVWSYYEEGRIQRKERDTDGDGKIDYWERFDEQGRVIKTGRDTDADGKVDERDE